MLVLLIYLNSLTQGRSRFSANELQDILRYRFAISGAGVSTPVQQVCDLLF